MIAADRPDRQQRDARSTLSGQVETMRESFHGLFAGMALAVVLVYLLMVINFQSWLDPVIVLLAVPFALAGVMWMLFLTQTAHQRAGADGNVDVHRPDHGQQHPGRHLRQSADGRGRRRARRRRSTAGYTRLRPVLMTAGAMILGMIPMALGVGEGGEQNAPLARAVIGGLLFATFATLVFVPSMYRLLRRAAARIARESGGNPLQQH